MSDIQLPEDRPRRRGRAFADYAPDFITLDEAESKAHGTGQHRGTVVQFSDDGKAWFETWVPTNGATHPAYARATVTRKAADGDLVERRVPVRWEEYVPAEDDDNRPEWDKMPTVMLGKVAVVAALRSLFRDVIGNRYEPAELHQAGAAA